jgi:Fuc2NAc and GlcNAc transferase
MGAAIEAALVAACAAIASAALTGVVRRYALRHRLLDVPNGRSAHRVPTPRAGGFAIAIVHLGGTTALGLLGLVDADVVIAVVGGGALVAVAGLLDDLRDLSPAVRVPTHFAAATWAVLWLGGLPSLHLGIGYVPFGEFGLVLGVLGTVWAINLYNFMDGIDGIAGVEAVTVGGAAAALLLALGAVPLALVAFLFAGASAGFLFWNWPPARIFMGDVGSGLLGFTFAVLAIASENWGALPLVTWVMLLGVFVLDATATLVRRVARGEPFHQPHARHAYQRATRFYGSHARVTTTVLALNAMLAVAATLAVAFPRLLLPIFFTSVLALASLYRSVERLSPMWARR